MTEYVIEGKSEISKEGYAYKLIPQFIVFALIIILFAKYYFADSSNVFLFSYGVCVTLVVFITFFVTFILYKDPYEEAKKKPHTKKNYRVTCLVAVKNEERVIHHCIESFLHQTYHNKEIIFINDASTDKTGEVMDRYAKDGSIKVIHLTENVGKKRALAQGMLIAEGEIFAFSDSDSIVAHDAIEKIVEIFEAEPLVGAVSGHCRAWNGDHNLWTKIQDSWYEGQFSIRKAFESVFDAVTCVSGPLAVFRKETIYNFIPAWENDTFLGQEFRFATDRTLTGFTLGNKVMGKKLKARYADSPFVKNVDYPLQDWKIVYCKSARAWTNVPDTFSKVIRQQIRWKKSFLRNIFFTGFFYWRKPLLASIVYYLHVLFVLFGPFIAFRHLVYLPLQGTWQAAFLYVGGIIFIGYMFGLAYKLEDPGSHRWMYRPLMSLLSVLVFSWLLFYSAVTIRKMIWHRG